MGLIRMEFLEQLAIDPRWSTSREVRLAMLRNPRTPVPAALSVVRRLSRALLVRLAGDDEFPKIVRVGANRQLERGASPA